MSYSLATAAGFVYMAVVQVLQMSERCRNLLLVNHQIRNIIRPHDIFDTSPFAIVFTGSLGSWNMSLQPL